MFVLFSVCFIGVRPFAIGPELDKTSLNLLLLTNSRSHSNSVDGQFSLGLLSAIYDAFIEEATKLMTRLGPFYIHFTQNKAFFVAVPGN